MRLAKFAVTAGFALSCFVASAKAVDVTFSQDGSQVDTSSHIVYLGTALSDLITNPSGTTYGSANGAAGTNTAVFQSADITNLPLAFSNNTSLTKLHPAGGSGYVYYYSGGGLFTNVSDTVYADAIQVDGSGQADATHQITTSSSSVVLPDGVLSEDFPTISFPGPVDALQPDLEFILENATSPGDAPPGGVYLILMQPGASADNSELFGILVGVNDGETPVDISGATIAAEAEIVPEPASLALLAIGGVMMLRRGRREA